MYKLICEIISDSKLYGINNEQSDEIKSYDDGISFKDYETLYDGVIEDFSLIKIGTAFSGSVGGKIINLVGPKLGQYALEYLSQNILARKYGKNTSDMVI